MLNAPNVAPVRTRNTAMSAETTAANGPSMASAGLLRPRVATALVATIGLLTASDRIRAKVRAKVRALTTAETHRIIASASPLTPKPLRRRLNPPSSAPSKTMAACACPS